MKRLLVSITCVVLLFISLAPTRAEAALYPPWWVVFTFTADPLDPLGGTSTGWHYLHDDDGAFQRPQGDEGDIDFWWQAHHWTAANTLSETLTSYDGPYRYSFWISGGPEGNFIEGNNLDLNFDIEVRGGATNPEIGMLYSAFMFYVNPTASQFGRTTSYGLSYYLASGSFYITDQQPPAASPPGVTEPPSLALLVVGLFALGLARTSRGPAAQWRPALGRRATWKGVAPHRGYRN